MTFRTCILLSLATLALAAATPVRAAPYEESQQRKSWFSFLRPARTTPAAQLVYARDLQRRGHWIRAGRHFHALVATWPAAPEAPVAQYEWARMLEDRGNLADAFDQYQVLMERYAAQARFDEILTRQYDLANRTMSSRRLRFLFGGWPAYDRAVPMFERIVTNAPAWSNAAQCQFNVGRLHELDRETIEALTAYTAVQYRFGQSAVAEEAAFRRTQCLAELCRGAPNDLARQDETWGAVVQFLRDYPHSAHAPLLEAQRDRLLRSRAQAAYDMAVYYDRHGKTPDAARTAYERFLLQFPNTELSAAVRKRLQDLGKPTEGTRHEQDKSPPPT